MGFKPGDQAEKSPVVHYANWKENIILNKKLNILNRSEKNVVHRIKIDQKVLFKRFQGKLHRSKLAQARAWGDKDSERQLRASHRKLNIDIINTEKDYEFLEKLNISKRKMPPRIRYENATPQPTPVKPEKKLDNIIKSVFPTPKVSKESRPRSRSLTEGIDMNMSISGKEKSLLWQAAKLAKRPSTTGGTRFQEAEVVLPASLFPQLTNIDKLKVPAKTVQFHGMINKAPNLSKYRPTSCKAETTKNGTLKLTINNKDQSPLHSRRPSLTSLSPTSPRSRRSSMFDVTEKPDIASMMLERSKKVDFTDKVKDFCDSLEEQREKNGPVVDYYSLRLEAKAKSYNTNHTTEYPPVPGTPEVENKRHIGNLDIVSLTFKPLNFDFSRREHINVESLAPDMAAVIYDSADEDSDYSDD